MHAYAEILDPSVVSHAQFVMLAGEPCLVLVRGASLLQVFADIYSPLGPRWLCEFPLDGTVTQLETLSGSDLLVTFKFAKLVVLDWDPAAVSFVTRSLHYYEKVADASEFGPSTQNARGLAVDRAKQSVVFCFERDVAAFIQRRELGNPLFPQLAETSKAELKSSEFPLLPLASDDECSEVVHATFMPMYTVPTVAVLYWVEPGWAGLVPKTGERTKALVVASVWNAAEGSVVLSIPNVRFDVFKIVPVHTQGSLMLLIGASTLSFVDEAGVLTDIALEGEDARLRFENCEAAELPNSDWVILVLQSGTLLAVNMITRKIEHLRPAGFAPEPTCLAVSDKHTFVVGSRLKHSQFCRAEIRDASQPKFEAAADFSVKALYDWLADRPTQPTALLDLTTLHSFKNVGALTAITPIDDGIACASGDSLVIIERELPLIDQDRVEPPVDLAPGRFWVLNDAKPNSKLLLVSSKTLDRLEREDDLQSDLDDAEHRRKTAKRRNTKQSRESTLFYDLSAPDNDNSSHRARKRPKQIRAFATDQATLAVYEGSEVVVVVQTRSLSAYEAGSWRFLSATPIPTACFAEIHNDLIITQHKSGHEARVYSGADLSLIKTVPDVELAAICKSFLLTSRRGCVTVSSPVLPDRGKTYNLANLDRLVTAQEGELNAESEESDSFVALFTLEYCGTNYIGVHRSRLFCVYELVNDVLLKRFTVPFMVNQSPVWLPSAQLLVFLGPQSHALVKSRHSGFACHPLQTDGLYTLDVTACCANAESRSSSDSSNSASSFVWLDDRQRLHFSRLDPEVDFLSNRLPYRRIEVAPEIVIQNIAYHDDTQAIMIGANRVVKYEEAPPTTRDDDADDNNQKEGAKDDGKDDLDKQEDQLEEDGSSPSPEAFVGCVYILPLSDYKPVEVQNLELNSFETIVSLECVDHCDAGGRQLVAIGTAQATEEDLQCNGYIYLYRVEEARETPLQDGSGDDAAAGSISLQFFAKDYLRGAVSSIAEVMGFLAVAHGQQIRVYNFHKELEPVGFFDTEVYMKDLKAVRNLLLLGEELRGPRLVNFGLQPHRMDLLCSDEAGRNVRVPLLSVAGVSNAYKGDLCLVSCDTGGRLQVLQYDPENLESAGGTRFVPLASFHTGRKCVGFSAVELANEDLIAYGATQDGVVFSVAPISEEAFRTLFVLTQQMMDKEQSLAGLNPREHRQMLATASNHEHHLIDINYSQRLWNLPIERQLMYSRKLGFNGLSRAHRALNSSGRDSLKL